MLSAPAACPLPPPHLHPSPLAPTALGPRTLGAQLLAAKEEALSRLEDLHSLATKQLDKDAACCAAHRPGRAKAEEAARGCKVTLQRCERQLGRAEERVTKLLNERPQPGVWEQVLRKIERY